MPEEEPNDIFACRSSRVCSKPWRSVCAAVWTKPDRVAAGGHSCCACHDDYFLAHSDLTRAGIDRSDAFIRTR
jgi:hypothetical protein